MTTTLATFEVQLAIYDLSHGMARQLSAQFLGGGGGNPQYTLEAIPHSGVVVYGLEYFFGSGIQWESPVVFRQMTGLVPMQILSLGRTSVTRMEFEQWCQEQMSTSLGGRFTMQSYDLLECNCNHFAHTAALEGLQLSQGVPDWVLQVPQRFLASPFGQLVRPMLDQMQLRTPVGRGRGEGGTPTMIHTMPNEARSALATTPTSSILSPTVNPWATATTTHPLSSEAESVGVPSPPRPHPLLDTFVKALLSKDTKTVPLCIQKIVQASSLEPEQTELLQRCQETLQSSTTMLSLEDASQLCDIFLRLLERQQAVIFVLVLLRILVTEERYAFAACRECLQWIQQHVIHPPSSDKNMLPSSTQAMSWLVLSNAIASAITAASSKATTTADIQCLWSTPQGEEAWIQAAIRAMTTDVAPSVRQPAAACCYNIALLLPLLHGNYGCKGLTSSDQLGDTQVTLLVAALEDLTRETDHIVLLRRLMTAGRILVPLHSSGATTPSHVAIELARNLGLQDSLPASPTTTQRQGDDKQTEDADTARRLALEIRQLLDTPVE